MDSLLPLIAVIVFTAIATGALASAVGYHKNRSILFAMTCFLAGTVAGVLAPVISLIAIAGYAWKDEGKHSSEKEKTHKKNNFKQSHRY